MAGTEHNSVPAVVSGRPVPGPTAKPSATSRAVAPSKAQPISKPAPSFAPSPIPSAMASPVPASPSPVATVAPSEAKSLAREFARAQQSELKALEHRQKIELRELVSSQNARRKDWEKREREARHQFFKEHSDGKERRSYVQDFLARRKALLAFLGEERTQRKNEQDVRRQSLKDEHAQRSKEFHETLQKGLRPAENLWPSPGR